MKRILFALLICLPLIGIVMETKAQSGPYGNEWIDYNKTYFKFKVGADGVYRIGITGLWYAGLPSTVQGANLMMYRDGKEIPIAVSQSGTLSSTDYIEFYGEKASGILDKELYETPSAQANEHMSLFSDTACYYLSYDNNTNHFHYRSSTQLPSGAIPTNLPAQNYLIASTANSYRNTWVDGPSLTGAQELVSSKFEAGEGFVNSMVNVYSQINSTLVAPNLVAGVAGMIQTSIITRSYGDNHRVKLLVNGTELADSSFGAAATQSYNLVVPPAQLSTTNNVVYRAVPMSTAGSYDNYGISYARLLYPRNLDMAGQSELNFQLPQGYKSYFEFTNIAAAKIYDLENGIVSISDNTLAGKSRFLIFNEAKQQKDFVIIADAAARKVPRLDKVIRFTDYSKSNNQGDFVIISHPYYHQLVAGHDNVQDYVDYRKSATGGAHSVVEASISELYDQFAYGYDIHPMSIKHFLKFAYDNWTTKPQDVLLLGRGLIYHYYPNYQTALGNGQFPYAIIPTFGHPGSDIDFVMFGDFNPRMRIGRVPAWTPAEVGGYLDKVKAYEAAAQPATVPTPATELWKKRALHVAGSSDVLLQNYTLLPSLNIAAGIVADTPTGIVTTTISKSVNTPIQIANNALLNQRLQEGTLLATFYGHGSENSFDYGLPNPVSDYSNTPHFPFFTALGCDVSQMFTLTPQKFLAERYVMTPQSGSICFLGSDNVSYPDFDDLYLHALYRSINQTNYGAPLGTHYVNALKSFGLASGTPSSMFSAQLESLIFCGDPSLKLPSPTKPDYAVTADGISAIPTNVTTSLDSFSLKIITYNLAKFLKDSVLVKIEHINPKGELNLLKQYKIANLSFSDTSYFRLPVSKINDLGMNKYKVTIDADNRFDEVSEMNNTATLELFIYSDNLIPIYPREFAIVHDQGVTLKASTLNVFRRSGSYKMELDTTELFNSPSKLSTTINSPGGVIKWTPTINMKDSTVYYWRVAFDSAVNGSLLWAASSFIYLEHGSDGWNQSHYFQYQKDNSTSMVLYPDRKFYYTPFYNKLEVLNTVIGGSGNMNADGVFVRTYWNGNRIEQSSVGSVRHGLQISVIDTSTGQFWLNDNKTPGAANVKSTFSGLYCRQFDMSLQSGRNYAAQFINSIPDGKYVLIRNVWWHNMVTPIFVDTWKADSTSAGGLANTLYGVLKKNGFNIIDSFDRERVFIMFRIKGDQNYPVYQSITDALTDHLDFTADIKGKDSKGDWNSTVIGPATKWESFKWKSAAYDTLGINDTSSVSIYGIYKNGLENLLFSGLKGDTSLASVSATSYPNIRLVWHSGDQVDLSSQQLKYWRVLYSPLPEAALNPAIHFVFSDSLAQGQMQTFSSGIEMLNDLPMDSMLVRYKIVGNDGVSHQLADVRYRPMKAGFDTLNAQLTFDPAAYPGKNFLFVEVNPDNDQPELYHPNNLGYLPFTISVDNHNPLLDVTFDGQHILNGDIVSAKPFINIKLKDENNFLKLDDTSLLQVTLTYPGETTQRPVSFDGNICKFIPATTGGAGNTATVEFRPELLVDGQYRLSVNGTDKTGNVSGGKIGSNTKVNYQIAFEVDNKPSITNLLNYPNPFSTATAFVFTLTGTQIPSQFKIQILSVTGKVVREITKEELGPLHIGRNITEYKWDGKDQYGQVLGNGVYLYREVTSINGQQVDHRENENVDKYFKNGYGKMYIMR